jgi:hypothetical protein
MRPCGSVQRGDTLSIVVSVKMRLLPEAVV